MEKIKGVFITIALSAFLAFPLIVWTNTDKTEQTYAETWIEETDGKEIPIKKIDGPFCSPAGNFGCYEVVLFGDESRYSCPEYFRITEADYRTMKENNVVALTSYQIDILKRNFAEKTDKEVAAEIEEKKKSTSLYN